MRPKRNVDPLAMLGLPPGAIATGSGGPPLPPHWRMNKRQTEFVALPHLEALYGGAAGGGKTEALLADAAIHARRRGFKALILRRTFTALNLPASIMHRALEWWGREYWNASDKRFTWPVGSIVQFGYADNVADLDRYKSAQFHRIYIDELTEWPLEWYTFLFSRVRRLRGDTIPLGVRAATNPDGIGAEWVRRRFGLPEGEVIEAAIESGAIDATGARERVFLPARVEDNPALDLVAYERSLANLGPVKYQQLRFGRWLRDGEGLVYAHFDAARNSATGIPALDYRILSIDFGFIDATGFAILGWRANSNIVYVERCWKETGLTPSDVAERVAMLCAETTFERIIGDTGGLGKGYAEEMRIRWGIPIEAAEKANKRGYIDLLNGALARGQLIARMPECEQLVEEWAVLPWDEARRAESAGFENHCADAALYGWRAATAFHEIEKPAAETDSRVLEAAEEEARRERRRGELAPQEGWARYRRIESTWEARHPGRRR